MDSGGERRDLVSRVEAGRQAVELEGDAEGLS